jgi:hypothetical protein
MPDLSLRAVLGARTWGNDGVFGQQYIPGHGVLGIEARFLRTGRTWFAFDLLNGSGTGQLQFDELGTLPVTVGSTSLGGAIGFATRPAFVRVGLGAKSEVIGIRRTFPNGEAEPQATAAVAVGPGGFVGIQHGRFSADLQFNFLLMATRFDERDERPSFSEPLLAIGYRF